MEEPTTQLTSPSASISFLQYSTINSTTVLGPVTGTPLLCGNTSSPASIYSAVSPIYYSATGRALAAPKPFVFGAGATNPTISAPAYGASFAMSWPTGRLTGDPALVCYGLDANGVHGPTPGVMRDEFEGPTYSPTLHQSFNSSVVLNVFHTPASSTDFYGYTIDVTIPATPANVNCSLTDCNFALIEGFDTAVFDPNGQQTHPDEGWCIGSAGSTSCSTSTVEGGLNINYSTWANSLLPHLTTGGAPVTYRFVVKRYFAATVTSLPASGDPVVLAALFSPFDLDENEIGDNVAVGYANTPPAVVQSGDTWTTFTNHLAALSEGTDSSTLAFNISDSDTSGPMTAAVTLNLNGLSVPVTPSCTATSVATGAAAQCSIDVNFADPNWWNASVASTYAGQGNVFATDPGAVSASISIVATDALGKKSAAASAPMHVQSTVNNAPVVAYGPSMPSLADSFQNNQLVPTFSCSLSAPTNSCGRYVDLIGVISAAPGPAAAFDELASQTTALVAYTGNDANGGNVQCVAEQGTVFIAGGAPQVAAATAGSYSIDFLPSATVGSALCTVNITDAMAAFPAGETAKTTTTKFRIVIAS